jgi:hypothetical protein
MLRLTFATLKYFALGLILGLLTAPRSGVESRNLLMSKGFSAAKDILPTTGGTQGNRQY